MKTTRIFFLGLLLTCIHITAQNSTRTGILILGSSHIPTLKERVNSGYKLFKSLKNVDYIIVSGGCDAHKSGFCEASKMKEFLESKGISGDLIYKEEQSQSTFQNYCYSRHLKNNKGDNLIQEGDSLYVVSNHWHAIPVAARFRKYDNVNAQYYILGRIIPKDTDSVNYANIYSNISSNCMCNKICH